MTRENRLSVLSIILKQGWTFLAAALLVHLSFVVYNISYILDPSDSPYGHSSPFGDKGRVFFLWAIGIPGLLVVLSSLIVVLAGMIRAGQRLVLPKHGWFLWFGGTSLLIYLAIADITLFSD